MRPTGRRSQVKDLRPPAANQADSAAHLVPVLLILTSLRGHQALRLAAPQLAVRMADLLVLLDLKAHRLALVQLRLVSQARLSSKRALQDLSNLRPDLRHQERTLDLQARMGLRSKELLHSQVLRRKQRLRIPVLLITARHQDLQGHKAVLLSMVLLQDPQDHRTVLLSTELLQEPRSTEHQHQVNTRLQLQECLSLDTAVPPSSSPRLRCNKPSSQSSASTPARFRVPSSPQSASNTLLAATLSLCRRRPRVTLCALMKAAAALVLFARR